MVCLALGVAALSACGGGDKKITYDGGSVTAVVGEASSATVATATGGRHNIRAQRRKFFALAAYARFGRKDYGNTVGSYFFTR